MVEKMVKVDNELWNRIRKDFQPEDDRVVLEKVFPLYFKREDVVKKNNFLKSPLSAFKIDDLDDFRCKAIRDHFRS